MENINRRKFIQMAGLFGLTAAVAPRLNPNFLVSSAYAADKINSGKTLNFYASENLTGNWDPTSHTTASQLIFESMVFGTLTRAPMTESNPDELKMELAESLTSIDKHHLQIKLKSGITFHDGTLFTAEDVKATFEYASQPDKAAQWYPGPCKVQIVDDTTCILDTSEHDYPASLMIFLSAFLPIMCAKNIKNKTLSQKPNGTGPMMFVEQKGNTTVLKAFDQYYQGKPVISGINYSFVGDATTRTLALLNGEADLIDRLESEQVETIKSNPNMSVHKTLSVENKYLFFRCSKPPFNDPKVRLAACHAIDRNMIGDIMGEAGMLSKSHLSPIKFGYADVANYPEYDPKKCQQLLAEAGYPNGKGLPEIEYIVSIGMYPKTKEYGEVITALLQEQGFPVTLTVYDPATFNDRLYDKPGGGAGHMIDCGWTTGSPEPDLVLRTHFHSSAKRITGIVDPELDAALDKERNTIIVSERKKVLQTETLPLLADKVPAYSLFTSVFFHAMRADLQGLFIYPNGQYDVSKVSCS